MIYLKKCVFGLSLLMLLLGCASITETTQEVLVPSLTNPYLGQGEVNGYYVKSVTTTYGDKSQRTLYYTLDRENSTLASKYTTYVYRAKTGLLQTMHFGSEGHAKQRTYIRGKNGLDIIVNSFTYRKLRMIDKYKYKNGRLFSFTGETTSAARHSTIYFKYDEQGRRVEKSQKGSNYHTRYTYSQVGETVKVVQQNITQEKDKSEPVVKPYITVYFDQHGNIMREEFDWKSDNIYKGNAIAVDYAYEKVDFPVPNINRLKVMLRH